MSGASQLKTIDVSPLLIVKFLGGPMLSDALEAIGAAKSQPSVNRKAANILNFLVN